MVIFFLSQDMLLYWIQCIFAKLRHLLEHLVAILQVHYFLIEPGHEKMCLMSAQSGQHLCFSLLR